MGGGLSSFLAGSTSVFTLESVSLTGYRDGKRREQFRDYKVERQSQ